MLQKRNAQPAFAPRWRKESEQGILKQREKTNELFTAIAKPHLYTE
jgi:hypothetical protein